MVSSISSGDSYQIQELMAKMQKMRQMMKSANTDGVDGLSKNELSSISTEDDEGGSNFLKALTKNFDKIDTDKDGQLSNEEIKASKPKQQQMGPPPGMFLKDMSSYDTDGANGLSKDELSAISTDDKEGESDFLSALTKNFDKIDTDKDGQLSNEEIKASKPKHQHMEPPPESSESDSSTTDSESLSSNLLDFFKKQISSTYGTNDSSADVLSSLDQAV